MANLSLTNSERPGDVVTSYRTQYPCAGTPTTVETDMIPIAQGHWKTVLVSDETEGWKDILRSGGLLPYKEYHVVGKRFKHVVTNQSGRCPYGYVPHLNCCSEYEYAGPAFLASSMMMTHEDFNNPWEHVDHLVQKAYARADQGASQALVELAELRETIGLFTNYHRDLNKRVSAVLRETRRRGRPTWDLFSNTWLSYRYGWRQLVFSSKDIADAYGRMASLLESRIVHGHAREIIQQPSTGSVGYTHGEHPSVASNILSATCNTTLRGSVAIRISKERWAIDTNPMAALWDLVPYSFVVDWFTNASDLFRASLSFLQPEMTACASFKKSAQLSSIVSVSDSACAVANCPSTYTSSVEVALAEWEEYHRKPYASIPLTFDINREIDLSWEQITDLVTLATGRYNRLRRQLRN